MDKDFQEFMSGFACLIGMALAAIGLGAVLIPPAFTLGDELAKLVAGALGA
jgi:hypothetical protein